MKEIWVGKCFFWIYLFIFIFFETGCLLPRLECSGVIIAHCILDLPGSKPSSQLSLQNSSDHRHTPPCPANFCIFWRDGVLPYCPGWPWTLGLKQSSCLGLPKFWDYRHEPPCLAWLCLFVCLFIYLFFPFYCILSFGVHVQNMQDSCIGTHMAM